MVLRSIKRVVSVSREGAHGRFAEVLTFNLLRHVRSSGCETERGHVLLLLTKFNIFADLVGFGLTNTMVKCSYKSNLV